MRAAGAEDLDEIVALDPLARAGDATRVCLLTHAVGAGQCLVHVHDDGVTGLAITKPRHFFGRDFVELLGVAPAARRSGVGRRLLQAVVGAPGTLDVFTSTNESNAAMRALLASEGWRLSGRLGGLDDGDPELVFFTRRARRTPLVPSGRP